MYVIDETTMVTRLRSNLRQTTLECVYFRSRDKDCGHVFRSAIFTNPNSRLHGAVFYRTWVIADWSLTLREYGISRFGATVTLTLTRWLSYMNLTCIPWPWKMYLQTKKWTFYVKAFESYHTCRHSYIQTPPKGLPWYHATSRVVIKLIKQGVESWT